MIGSLFRLAVAFWCLAVTVAASAAADEGAKTPGAPPAKHTLRYKFQPGETVRWNVVHQARVETTISGTTQTTETLSTSTKAWRVAKVGPDGTAAFENLVENVDMRHKVSGRMEVRYNSQSDKKPPPGFDAVAKAVGVPLARLTMDAKGKILKREHLAGTPPAEGEGQITLPLPEKPVAVGEGWSLPYGFDVPMENGTIKKIKALQTFTLEGVSSGVATVRVATQFLTPIHDPALEARIVQRESAGTVRFDLGAGRVLGQQMETDKRVVGFAGQAASSLSYRMRFTEELLKKDAATAEKAKPAPTETQSAQRPTPAEAKTTK